MQTLAGKYFTFLFLTIFGGGWTAPLGLPPAAEDPATARVAPEKCLFYASWAGAATADPKSKNQTEQLLAEPEVQRSFAALATLMSDTVLPQLMHMDVGPAAEPVRATGTLQPVQPGQTGGQEHDTAAIRQAAMDFAKIVATHSGAVFVTKVKVDKACWLQDVRGGMLVRAGQDADKLRAVFDQFRTLVETNEPRSPDGQSRVFREVQIAGHTWYRYAGPMSIAPVTCGFQDADFILGIGDGSVEEILKRREQQQPPAWLVDMRKQLPVERTSMVVYLNLKLLLDQVTADVPMRKTQEALRRLGLDKISAVCSVSGLEGEMFVSKLLLATDGEPRGPLLNLFSDQPLRPGDLTPIPCDATLALAMRFDAQKLFDQYAAMVQEMAPVERTAVENQWDSLTKSLQVDLRRELPKALGDSCCVYCSPGEGGLVVLGLTAVMPIRDRDAWSVIQAKFLSSSLAKGFMNEVTAERGSHQEIHSFSFAGQRIFYITGQGFGGAAWCATQRELIVATAPQYVMAYLQHGPGYKSLATVPQVARAIEGTNGPSMLEEVDTAKLFELLYPFVPYAMSSVPAFFAPAQRLPPLDAIPSAPAIRRHLVPGTAALRRTKRGLELISRQPLPGTGLLWTAAGVLQDPQALERQVAAEGRPRTEISPFVGQTAVPAPEGTPPTASSPAIAPAAEATAPGAASGSPPAPAVAPAATYTPAPTTGGYGTAPPPATGPVPGYAVPGDYTPLPAPGYSVVPVVAPPGVSRLFSIGMGVKAYRTKYHTMPPAYLADKRGKPLLSWRVALLPYLGQEDLYKRFHLDEPWDGPHNRKLLAPIPDVYKDPDATFGPYPAPAKAETTNDKAGKTQFLLLRGPKTVYADPAPPMPRTYEEWLKVIVVVVRSERAVPWTKPEEFTYDAKDPSDGLVRKSGGEFTFMMLEAAGVPPAFPFLNSPPPPSAAKERERDELLRHFTTGEEATVVAPPPGWDPFGPPPLPQPATPPPRAYAPAPVPR